MNLGAAPPFRVANIENPATDYIHAVVCRGVDPKRQADRTLAIGESISAVQRFPFDFQTPQFTLWLSRFFREIVTGPDEPPKLSIRHEKEIGIVPVVSGRVVLKADLCGLVVAVGIGRGDRAIGCHRQFVPSRSPLRIGSFR